nr:alpha-2-macroglobulin family protein [Roseovarius sp. W115]MDV2930196.1 alpha-2-macroglobulin family protein [Roseovarius sp. W115]
MLRHFACLLLIAFTATSVSAQSPVPEKRQVVTQDTDFFGSDLEPLFDTTVEACRNACFANQSCKAYTFNARANSCFPKSALTETQAYEGAVSAEILLTDTRVLNQAQARANDLSFLSQNDLQRARQLALDIGARHPGGQRDTPTMVQAAQDRVAQKDYLNAMRWMGAAVARSDLSDQWVEYARLSRSIETQNANDKRRYAQQALEASTNAYLRGLRDAERANALLQMADALEALGRGRNMVPALRLAEAIQPREDVVTALEAAIAKYGFRIVQHRSDHESAVPRVCAEFSDPLVKAGVDYTPFVRLPDAGLVVQADTQQICISGVEHGERYRITFRAGLPAASGETLTRDVEIAQYVRDRSPSVGFAGRAYVLPKSADAALPIETVNLDEVDLVLRRVSDRNLLRAIQDNYFGRPLSAYEDAQFSSNVAEEVWTGEGLVQNELNQTMTTRLPLGDVLAEQAPGVYALTAHVPGANTYEDPGATQWFVLTDLGLTTLKGTDGLHVFVRQLSDAAAVDGVKVTLLSRANRVLGESQTNAEGHTLFAPGLARGTGGAAPAMVIVEQGEDDMAFLSLTDPAFDLSDRGVEGRPAAPPIDLFATTDRGAYRAGETIHVTALARDGNAKAIPDLPLTAILKRPDGVEYARKVSNQSQSGGHVFAFRVSATVPRGTWTIDLLTDPTATPVASQTVLVEDFLPERIDFDLSLAETPIKPGDTAPLSVEARYLFGAPGAGLKAEGSVTLSALQSLDAYPGYTFGRHDEWVSPQTTFLEGGTTDASGALTLNATMPEASQDDRPYEARFAISLKEGSGRPVERRLTKALAPSGPMIGIRPSFEGVVSENSSAEFQIIGIGPDLAPSQMDVTWTLNRVETRYQWYQAFGNWNWEPITTREQVTTGTAALGDEPLDVSGPVKWGRYELVVERTDGAYVASSSEFYAGWYAPADASSTPDTLELSLDREDYRPGDTANLRLVPRYAGTALVTVMSNRVIHMEAYEVVAGDNLIPLTVTDDWGAGAYVTAQVIRPMDVASGQNPARALGLSYAKIDPGKKQLSVSILAPDVTVPRQTLPVSVQVDGIPEGETAYMTLAAVDLGILNLTGFESPDPSAHYFGQRRLGVEIRDLYGRLIDGMNGAQGQVRSGGDAGAQMDLQSPPPTEELVSFFTGPVKIGPNGSAEAQFDIPDFNGTVRLMAVVWSDTSVGQSEADTIIRDPVVVTASLPRFMAPGDQSEILLEITHAEGPAGRMGLDISAQGLTLAGNVPSGLDLSAQEKAVLRIPISAKEVGNHELRVALTTPDGQQLIKDLTLGVRSLDPEVSSTRRFSLAPGDTFTLNEDVFAGLRRNTAEVLISSGAFAKLDAPGLLSALERYPYGCTEQVVSQALPLLYFQDMASALGLGNADQSKLRITQSIERILTRQSSGGGFGLWRASSGDFWLDAYVADFLSRARDEGYDVPDHAYTLAMDNLRNRVNYAPDFDKGGEDIAYALMVLAREGAARMGDLRYYADVKAGALATPLALAQLGAALAYYGDQTRADRMFTLAVAMVTQTSDTETQVWRVDYGTRLRDRAGVLTLASEAGSNAVNVQTLAQSLATSGPNMSTQEQAWSLLATQSLLQNPNASHLTLDGAPLESALIHKFDAGGLGTHTITNQGNSPTEITLTTLGVPETAPEAGGYGYAIDRSYYDLDGQSVDPAQVVTGTRLVTVLTVKPFEKGEARLMVNDPLPAGFEIDNPNLLRAGDIRSLSWLERVETQHTEFRSERFLAAVDWRSDKPFRLAYIVRAVAPGDYHHPAASVEDMYRPQYRARSATGRMTVTYE